MHLFGRLKMLGLSVLAGLVTPALAATLSSQPVLWEDLADLDIFRVGSDYYYSASTMHYSPGAPLLHSKDLINWEYIGHSVPELDWGNNYSLQGAKNAYVKGVFASSARQRPSDGKWFWVGCVEYNRSYIYTASSPSGPWTKYAEFPSQCYYDCGLLFDSDDTPYIAYGGKTIKVAKMAKDLKSEVSSQSVFTHEKSIEGSRMYKIKDTYYILNVDPGAGIQYVSKSSSVFGPYTSAKLANGLKCPVAGAGKPHQGGIVDDPQGNWYYMAFCNVYPGGRIPVLAPIIFNNQGFPQLPNINEWPSSVNTPMQTSPVQASFYQDNFQGHSLSHKWEWNHNPAKSAFNVNNGLTLRTATVTNDIFLAQNTLTHRIPGPKSRATIKMSFSGMRAGDRAGLVLLRDSSAWVGVIHNGSKFTVGVWSGCTLTSGTGGWTTTSLGSLQASANLPDLENVWLRATADIAPSGNSDVMFAYSTDGSNFVNIGNTFVMKKEWPFFMGYRFGIFNFATQSLGGVVQVSSFTLDHA